MKNRNTNNKTGKVGKGPACRECIYYVMKPERHSISKGELSKVEENKGEISFQYRPPHLICLILPYNFWGLRRENTKMSY